MASATPPSPPKPAAVPKALNAGVMQPLRDLGFPALSGKRCVRVSGDVAQFLFVHVENRDRRRFMIEYCALLVCEPHETPNLLMGGQFPASQPGTWYRADSDEALADSVARMAGDVRILAEWFAATGTVRGFLDGYELRIRRGPASYFNTGYASLTRACGLAALGDAASALRHARQARDEFRRVSDASPHARWALDYADHARELAEAVEHGRAGPLLDQWRARTRANLRLPG